MIDPLDDYLLPAPDDFLDDPLLNAYEQSFEKALVPTDSLSKFYEEQMFMDPLGRILGTLENHIENPLAVLPEQSEYYEKPQIDNISPLMDETPDSLSLESSAMESGQTEAPTHIYGSFNTSPSIPLSSIDASEWGHYVKK